MPDQPVIRDKPWHTPPDVACSRCGRQAWREVTSGGQSALACRGCYEIICDLFLEKNHGCNGEPPFCRSWWEWIKWDSPARHLFCPLLRWRSNSRFWPPRWFKHHLMAFLMRGPGGISIITHPWVNERWPVRIKNGYRVPLTCSFSRDHDENTELAEVPGWPTLLPHVGAQITFRVHADRSVECLTEGYDPVVFAGWVWGFRTREPQPLGL